MNRSPAGGEIVEVYLELPLKCNGGDVQYVQAAGEYYLLLVNASLRNGAASVSGSRATCQCAKRFPLCRFISSRY